MSMTLPDPVYSTLTAVVAKYPHTGTDEDRREAMQKVVETVRARHGLRYVWKTEHASLIAPSKDGMGFVPDGDVVEGRFSPMFIWDTINGSTRQPNPAPLVSEELRSAYVLTPEPHDWLMDGDEPEPPTPPDDDLEARVAALEQQVANLQSALVAVSEQSADASGRADAALLRAGQVDRKLSSAQVVADPGGPHPIDTNSAFAHRHQVRAKLVFTE